MGHVWCVHLPSVDRCTHRFSKQCNSLKWRRSHPFPHPTPPSFCQWCRVPLLFSLCVRMRRKRLMGTLYVYAKDVLVGARAQTDQSVAIHNPHGFDSIFDDGQLTQEETACASKLIYLHEMAAAWSVCAPRKITFSIFIHTAWGTYGCGENQSKMTKLILKSVTLGGVYVAWHHPRFLHVSHQQFRHQVNNDGVVCVLCVEDVRRLKLSNCSLDGGDLSHAFHIDGNISECGGVLRTRFTSTFLHLLCLHV